MSFYPGAIPNVSNTQVPTGLLLALQGAKRQNQKREYMVAAKRYTAARNGGVPSPMSNIVNATNTSPIVYTTDVPHGYNAGDTVNVQGVVGNTNANVNGTVSASNLTATTFSVTGANGNAAYGDIVGVPGGATTDGPLTSGEGANLFYLAQGAIITEIQIISGDPLTWNDLELWVYSVGDAEAAPSLKIPFMNMVSKFNGMGTNTGGAGFDQYNLKYGNATFFTQNFFIDYQIFDLTAQTSNTGFNLRFKFPIPNVQRITIFNPNASTDGSANLYTQVEYTTDFTSPLKLKAVSGPAVNGAGAYASNFAAFDGADTSHSYDFLNISNVNPGWLVAKWFGITNLVGQFNSSMLERDFSFRRDGETNPSWMTSGSEDLWGCAFYAQGRVCFQGNDSFVAFNRPGGNFGGSQANAPIVWCAFKDWLASDGGLKFSNAAILRWELAPDTARVTANAAIHHTTLYYSL